MPASLGGLATSSRALMVDSWPVMEWLKNRQPMATKFLALIEEARSLELELLISSINLGEIYYNCWNEWSEKRADEVLSDIFDLPIRLVHPTFEDTLFAARIKGRYKVSYADAFAAVLAVELDAPVLTGDVDFLKMRASGLIAVEWMKK